MNATQEQFFDRQAIVERIVQGVSASIPSSFALIGAPLAGKSALLRYLASAQSPLRAIPPGETSSARNAPLKIVLLDGAHFAGVEELVAEWELATELSLQSASERSSATQSTMSPPRLPWRSVLLLDNLDRLLTASSTPNTIYAWLARIAVKTPIVATTTQPLHDLNGASPDIHWRTLTPLFLGSIDYDSAAQWLATYTTRWPDLATSTEELFDLTGRHPFLLQRLGDSLEEVQQMLAPGRSLGADGMPFIRLRLAEYGRPLFSSLIHCIQHPPMSLDSAQLMLVLNELLHGVISLEQVTHPSLPMLNWLINLAVVLYGEYKDKLGYRLFSPLFSDYLASHPAALNVDTLQQPLIVYNNENQADLYDQLTKMEVLLLRYLQNHSPAVVSVEQLLADVWKQPNASPRRVQEAIRRLRMQLDQQSPPIGEIRNERGRGYRFVPHLG